MAGTRDIKRQIISVKNTQKVTKAMKMVSAAKMRRAVEAMNATRPYAVKIREVVENLSGRVDENTNPFMQAPEKVASIGLLIINSDRGLCGAFNSNIVRTVNSFKSAHPDKEIKLFVVGKNAFDFYKKRSLPIIEKWVTFGGKISYETAKIVSKRVTDSFLKGEFDELYVMYNEFKSTATQFPRTDKLLPLAFEKESEDTNLDYIFEPGSKELLDSLIPRFIDFTIYHCLLESAAGEHGARMVAMDNATRSADDMIKKLTLNYNKARQAAITTDLLDIVNGAEALK